MAARVWGAATAERIGKKATFPDCSACRTPGPAGAAKRKKWGCESDAAQTVFTTGCSHCFGQAPHDEPCTECMGGVIEHRRCPSAVVSEAEPSARGSVMRAFQAIMALEAHGVVPYAGGWLEQSPGFHQACAVVNDERGRYQRIADEHREAEHRRRESERRANAAKPSGGRRR